MPPTSGFRPWPIFCGFASCAPCGYEIGVDIRKIVLGGPPRSGKSCLREGLKQAIRAIPDAPYPYVLTACPDGEGSWFQETVNRDPELARRLKEAYKAKFTPEFVRRIADSVSWCREPLTLVDIGGRTTDDNVEICSAATHIVILAGDTGKFPEWRDFARRVGLKVVAEIYSDYHGVRDVVETPGPEGILRGSLHHLERGEPSATRPMVMALARHLLALADPASAKRP